MNKQNIKLIFEHRFLIPKTSQVEWLKNFLGKRTHTKLWTKTFSLDKYYAEILKNQYQRGCNVKVLMDNTKSKHNINTPYQKLLNDTHEKPNTFSQNWFPLKTGSLHNKYVIFKNMERRKGKLFIQQGIVSGSFNLTISSEFKTNDLIIYYIEYPEDICVPGLPRIFESKNEALLQQNFGKSLYDFSKDWINVDLLCPICDSTSLSEAVYCHTMTFKEGGLHLLSDTGNYEACEECPNWCSDGDSPDIILFQLNNDSVPESVYVCSLCGAIFTESGGLIGDDLVVFFATKIEHDRKKMILKPQDLSNLTI
ncbi:hypothetical protein LCGC14_0951300 [marine sediment metagenome]|uniref:Phospholipase D-like domain-containing protein n=1 Tax=marine sediment metagenome TaxID=412755 RepID=A0A0F9RNN8_9ZZZZ